MGLSTGKTKRSRCYIFCDFSTLWERNFITVMHSGLEIQVQHLRELARALGSDVKLCKMFLSFFCH